MLDSALRAFLNQVLGETTEEQQKQARRGKWVSVRNAKGPGFTAPVIFYLFLCPACKQLSVDYLHGFSGQEHLNCQHCDE